MKLGSKDKRMYHQKSLRENKGNSNFFFSVFLNADKLLYFISMQTAEYEKGNSLKKGGKNPSRQTDDAARATSINKTCFFETTLAQKS